MAKSFCMEVTDTFEDTHEVIVKEDNIENLNNKLVGSCMIPESFERPDNGVITKIFGRLDALDFITYCRAIFHAMDRAGLDHIEDLADLPPIEVEVELEKCALCGADAADGFYLDADDIVVCAACFRAHTFNCPHCGDNFLVKNRVEHPIP